MRGKIVSQAIIGTFILCIYTGCATTKPCICPPVEVVIQRVPVPIPCPPPPEIPAPTLQIVSLSSNLTPWPDILLALVHDYVELQRVEAELRQVLATYATTPGTPP
jgi:hypothetical protein